MLTLNALLKAVEGRIGSMVGKMVSNTYPITDSGKVLAIETDGKVSPTALPTETWTFTLDDDTTVTKKVVVTE